MGTAVLKNPAAPAVSAVRPASGRWILNLWMDLLLFVATPLLIIPAVFLLQSSWVGVEAETIGVMVFSFGALGHHLPGMIRAYGDRELFQRFRARFLIAPVLLVVLAVAVAQYQLHTLTLVILIWGCWHGLMQVYGFVRIYDAKVGFHSAATAHWDWLLLASWFGTAQVFSDSKMADFLELWYQSGGLLIPPAFVFAFRWVCLGISIAILIGFLTNHVVQTYRGRIENKPTPNPVKLLLLVSGISFWWFAMVFVENPIVGVAFFEIFHDVQYLAIVWLYNCRRVNATSDLGGFMKFLFRRGPGMLSLYVGLVFVYGIYGFLHNRTAQDDVLQRSLLGLVWASTILHYYYDGFIWKVREKSTRLGLGLNAAGSSARVPQRDRGEWIHLLKCAPLLFVIGWLAFGELSEAAAPANKSDQPMVIATHIARMQNIAAAVPENLSAQQRAALLLTKFGMQQEAIDLLQTVLKRHPTFADGQLLLGDLRVRRREFDPAVTCFEAAAKNAKEKNVRVSAHHKLGEVYLQQKKTAAAKAEFHAALQLDPHFEESQKALLALGEMVPASS
jgi:tetratricopeptide repeat protein